MVALMACALAVTLGLYWFAFGLWPQSWLAFFGFGFLSVVLRVIYDSIEAEDKRQLR